MANQSISLDDKPIRQVRIKVIEQGTSVSANALPNAWMTPCVLQHQEVLVTFDLDLNSLLPHKRLQLLPTP